VDKDIELLSGTNLISVAHVGDGFHVEWRYANYANTVYSTVAQIIWCQR